MTLRDPHRAGAGRNEPCPCGSGRKYKFCCLRRSVLAAATPAPKTAPVASGGRQTFEEALRFHRLGLLGEAERACQAVLRQDSRHLGALRVLANIAHSSGRGADAEALLRRATHSSPHDAGVHFELGLVQIALQRPAEAISTLRRALTMEPTLVAAHLHLGIALNELGQHREARECLESALQLEPCSLVARVRLGDVLVELGDFTAATAEYREALAASPDKSPIQVRLGIALREMGDGVGSLEALRAAVTSSPAAPEPHYHLARSLLLLAQVREAIESVQEAIRLRGNLSDAHTLYGTALAVLGDLEGALAALKVGSSVETTRSQRLAILGGHLFEFGRPDRALECFRQKLELEPEDAATRHYVMALSGLNPDHASDEYVRQVFDGCAESFDQSLVGRLAYTLPQELTRAILTASERSTPWDVLDLGCGTGLVGAEIGAHAGTLVGIDLSQRMLQRSQERNVYTNLICSDLMSALNSQGPSCYDLVTAADVFVYVGKLDSVIPAVRRTLRANGLFAFSTETAEDAPDLRNAPPTAGYQLMTSGRYVHGADYLNELASRNGFEMKLLRKTRLRLEGHRPVMGWLAVWCAI